MTQTSATTRILQVCSWLGPGFVLLFLIGAVPLAGFIPPPDADDSARDVANWYLEDLDSIRAGCTVMAIASGLFLPWGLTIAVYTRHAEVRLPILFYTQVASVAVCTLVILFIPMFWGVASFRPGDASPDVTQSWNDAGWFGILFTWPPFSVWCAAIACSIFTDRRENPPYPRWVGYLNVWAALLYGPAACMIFTKTGPMSWSGVICFWVPVVVFFIWIVTMALLTYRAVSDEDFEPVGSGEPRQAIATAGRATAQSS